MLEFFAFEMLTGRRLTPLPASAGSWSLKVNGDEAISVTVPARSVEAERLAIWETTTLARTGLLAVEDGVPVAAGPLWKRKYTQGGNLEFTAGGLRSYFNRRVAVKYFTPSGSSNLRASSLTWPDGTVYTGFDFTASGCSLGTIAKRLVEESMRWPGGNLPIVLPPEELLPGNTANTRTYPAIDLKMVGAMLDNLSGVINGPDIMFRPYFSDDGLGIFWQMTVGTEYAPRLGNVDPSLIAWTIGAPTGGAFGLEAEEDGTGLVEEVFATGGRSSDVTLFSRWNWTDLPAAGFPLLQAVDTSHNDVTDRNLLSAYTRESGRLGMYPRSFWKMSSRKVAEGTPELGDYWVGDAALITVAPEEPVITPGNYARRIASISGALGRDHYDLVFSEAIA